MYELKPCPFCGGRILEVHDDYLIMCKQCHTIFVQPQPEKPQSMAAVWNSRKEKENETD